MRLVRVFRPVAHAVFDLVEEHQHEVGIGLRIVHRARDHVDEEPSAIARQLYPARFHAVIGLERLENRRAQFQPQFGPHHRDDVVRWLSAHVLQEPAGAVRQVHDVGVAAHQHARRRVLLHQTLMQVPERKLALARGRRYRHGHARAMHARRRQRHRRIGAHRHVGAVDTGLLVDHREQVGHAVGRLGAAQEQEAARPQRKMEGAQHVDLSLAVQVDQQVAAAHHVEPRERRVAEHVVQREQDVLA